jgi:hypothetical protein
MKRRANILDPGRLIPRTLEKFIAPASPLLPGVFGAVVHAGAPGTYHL